MKIVPWEQPRPYNDHKKYYGISVAILVCIADWMSGNTAVAIAGSGCKAEITSPHLVMDVLPTNDFGRFVAE